MAIQLFGSLTSPYVRHCRVALDQSKLDYFLEPTDQARSAALSPAKRVPFLRDGELQLTDSSVILQHIRSLAGGRFLPGLEEAQLYFLANALGESAINLMYMEQDGITPETSVYLGRQRSRVASTLEALNAVDLAFQDTPHDGHLRLAVILAWGRYRKRFDLAAHGNLLAFLGRMDALPEFAATAPPPQ